MDAPLVERDHALLHAGDNRPQGCDLLSLGHVLLGIGVDVEAALRRIERRLVVADLGEDAVQAARVDLRPEPTRQLRPQEGEHGAPEAGEAQAEGGDDAPIEELTPRDPERLGVHGREHRWQGLGGGRRKGGRPLEVCPGQSLDLAASRAPLAGPH